jgi:hypothetical protein
MNQLIFSEVLYTLSLNGGPLGCIQSLTQNGGESFGIPEAQVDLEMVLEIREWM